jgi:hypothetical protein
MSKQNTFNDEEHLYWQETWIALSFENLNKELWQQISTPSTEKDP